MNRPDQATWTVGQDAYGRTVQLRFERTYDGKQTFQLHTLAANQLDDDQRVTGLSLDALVNAARSAEAFMKGNFTP